MDNEDIGFGFVLGSCYMGNFGGIFSVCFLVVGVAVFVKFVNFKFLVFELFEFLKNIIDKIID